MDTDLLTVARQLAERGWLPGICADDLDASNGVATFFDAHANVYVLAEPFLHLAAHAEIVRRGWFVAVDALLTNGTSIDTKAYEAGPGVVEPGTTTLALLTCLWRACEEHERATHQASEKGSGASQ